MISSNHLINSDFRFKINELWLQFLWKSNVFEKENLFTTNGQSLKVIFPGWFNDSWGPDFKESRIIIGNTSYFGDVELHIDESAWHQHSHHTNNSYNKVILHVFLNKSKLSAMNTFGQTIPSLCLKSDFLTGFWKSLSSKTNLNEGELPGACGLSLNDRSFKRLKSIIQQAAEARLITKSQKFMKILKKGDQTLAEDILFSSICKSLGYGAHAEQMEAISQIYPYSYLRSYFITPQRQNRKEILSRWFGYLRVFDKADINQMHEDLRREWLGLDQHWRQLGEKRQTSKTNSQVPYRPYNNPVRRLVGLHYHLQSVRFKGLLGSWLRFLKRCKTDIHSKKGKSRFLRALDKMFPQPSWDPFSYFNPPLGKTNPQLHSRFIGRQKQLVVFVNSIIPFFLAWSRIHHEKELEKILFRLLLILPSEGKNRKIRFMENRLFIGNDTYRMKNSLGYGQGLIQIHDDSCTCFYEGCRRCSLLNWLRSTDT
ncbi:MAG: DUF2851 family protein [Proteobacteria bacterium]|nr:DUF2851 family protein [Pseudomonadota bacterium]